LEILERKIARIEKRDQKGWHSEFCPSCKRAIRDKVYDRVLDFFKTLLELCTHPYKWVRQHADTDLPDNWPKFLKLLCTWLILFFFLATLCVIVVHMYLVATG
jgi:hypothetical protein